MEPTPPGNQPPERDDLIDRRRVLAGGVSLAAAVWAAPAITRLPASYARGTPPPDPFTEIFDEPGTFTYTVPAGVTSLAIECWGAGGAGGGSTDAPPRFLFGIEIPQARGGAGGGGGAYASSVVTVAPGEILDITVPAGAVGNVGGDGVDGAEASVVGPDAATQTVIAAGGAGGAGNTSGGEPAGGGGGQPSASIGTTRNPGLPGMDGDTGFGIASGNGGDAASPGGGSGGISIGSTGATSDGNPGTAPGGGGGGARTSQAGGARTGGSGGDGQVIITFPP